jgi:hypothetical protein
MDDDGEQPMDLAEYAFASLESVGLASGRPDVRGQRWPYWLKAGGNSLDIAQQSIDGTRSVYTD